MNMNIKLKPKNRKDGKAFYFASLPESVRRSMGAKMQSFDIIGKGTIRVPKGTKAREYSWDGVFFGESKKNEAIVKSKYWQKPKRCVKILKTWMKKGVVLNLVITGGINIDVTIAELEFENYGAFGNIKYTIKLVEKRRLKIYTTNELKIAAYAQKTRERPGSGDGNAGGSYTVVSGDTLSLIAARKCGGVGRWTELYDTNAATIEAAAKAHGKSSSDRGYWLYPGTVLTLV